MTALAMQQMNQHNRQTNAGLKELKELSTVYKLVKRSNKVDQDLAIGLESQYPGIIRSRVAIGSFTDKPSERNVSITLEAVMETIKNVIKKIFESISNAIKKFKDWIMGIVNYFKNGKGSEETTAEKAAAKDKNWAEHAVSLTNELLESAFPTYKEKAKDKHLSDKELKDQMYGMVDDKNRVSALSISATTWAFGVDKVRENYGEEYKCFEIVLNDSPIITYLSEDVSKAVEKYEASFEDILLGKQKPSDFTVDVTKIFSSTVSRTLFRLFKPEGIEEPQADNVIDRAAYYLKAISQFKSKTPSLNSANLFKKEELTKESMRKIDNPVYVLCNNLDRMVDFKNKALKDMEGATKLLSVLESKTGAISRKTNSVGGDGIDGIDAVKRLAQHYATCVSLIKVSNAILAELVTIIPIQIGRIDKIITRRVSATAQILKRLGMDKEMKQLNSLAIVKAAGTIDDLLPKTKASTESDGVDYDDLSHDVSIQDEDDLAMALDAANEPSEAEYSDGI